MKEWLNDHVLELVSLVVAVVGVKGLVDFWSRLCEMFWLYPVETLFICSISASVAALIATYISRGLHRRRLAEKGAELAEKIDTKGEKIVSTVPECDRARDAQKIDGLSDGAKRALRLAVASGGSYRVENEEMELSVVQLMDEGIATCPDTGRMWPVKGSRYLVKPEWMSNLRKIDL